MKSEQQGPQKTRSVGALVLFGSIVTACVPMFGAGCGGDDSTTTTGGGDSGVDGSHDGSTGNPDHFVADGTMGTPDNFVPDGNTPEDAGTDSPEAVDSGEDATTPVDAGTDSPLAVDAGVDAGCSGSETACTVGSTAGLCVGGTCLPCNSPADNANCTAAYGGGTTSYVCAAAGSCVVGNCNVDSDCAGEICGLTTPNTCGQCTTDTQCQTDPNYGTGTICTTTAGAGQGTCVSSTCGTADALCGANASDVCCGTGTLACTPGNCCDNMDCAMNPAGSICGSTTQNQCGPCTSDSQCPVGDICDTKSGDANAGKCIATSGQCSGTPGALGGAPGTCADNANDMCCMAQPCIPDPSPPLASGDACCPGTSGDTYCKGKLTDNSATCTAGFVCTSCEAVSTSTPVYIVDPVNGSNNGTGSAEGADGGAQESCALKTVTRALQLIKTVGTALPTKIIIVGGSGVTVGAGETFPLVIPSNVTVTTETGPVTVQVASGAAGFVLDAANSSITSGANAPLTITTTVNAAVTPPTGGTNGILVNGNASSATTTISNVTITKMLDDGILVTAGSVAIGEGVVSSSNGIASATRAGLHVTGGEAVIDVPSGDTPTSFTGNTAHGIHVDTNGFINLTGAVTGTGITATSTVSTNGNVAAGVWIQQTPGVAIEQNVINGLVSDGNTNGNGMRIVAGSSVQVRNSIFLGNTAGNGVIISTNGTGANANNDISKIDLGTAVGNGGNTFQAVSGSGNNGAVGICLDIASSGVTLNAVGNTFRGITCASQTSTLLLNTKGCGNAAAQCAGGICDLGLIGAAANPNKFDVSECTQ